MNSPAPKPNSTKTDEGKVAMTKVNGPVDRIKIGLEIVLLAALTGCVGFVGGGYGGAVVVPEPNVYFWGGDHDRGAMCMFIVSAELQAERWRTRPCLRRRTVLAASTGENGEPYNSLDRNSTDKPMKFFKPIDTFYQLFDTRTVGGCLGILPADLYAAEQKEAPQKPVVAQRSFASPDEPQKPCRRPRGQR